MIDNDNGTITITVDQGAAGLYRQVPVRCRPTPAVVFEDHNYTPDQEGEAGGHYTWYWDNITVNCRGSTPPQP